MRFAIQDDFLEISNLFKKNQKLFPHIRMGSGTYTHRNGSNYVGQYVDGLREGQGTWTLYDGSRFAGIWKDNIRRKGKSFDEEGKEIGEYVNGEEEIYYKPSS